MKNYFLHTRKIIAHTHVTIYILVTITAVISIMFLEYLSDNGIIGVGYSFLSLFLFLILLLTIIFKLIHGMIKRDKKIILAYSFSSLVFLLGLLSTKYIMASFDFSRLFVQEKIWVDEMKNISKLYDTSEIQIVSWGGSGLLDATQTSFLINDIEKLVPEKSKFSFANLDGKSFSKIVPKPYQSFFKQNCSPRIRNIYRNFYIVRTSCCCVKKEG